jgi:hypothetical protein
MMVRTRSARLLLVGYLGFIVYLDLASGLDRSGVAHVPLGISDLILFGEVSIITHTIALALIVVLFVLLREPAPKPMAA